MRDLTEVLDQIMTIPELPHGLKHDLQSIKESAMYTAPELQYMCWDRAAECLSNEPEGEWSEQACTIFTGSN